MTGAAPRDAGGADALREAREAVAWMLDNGGDDSTRAHLRRVADLLARALPPSPSSSCEPRAGSDATARAHDEGYAAALNEACSLLWAEADAGRLVRGVASRLVEKIGALIESDNPAHDEPRAGGVEADGAALIAAERCRQVEAEGWTPDHDDEHDHGELARASACYAFPARWRTIDASDGGILPFGWPWDAKWWKPTPNDRVRELVKAGALIAAEIDRLNRARPPSRDGGGAKGATP